MSEKARIALIILLFCVVKLSLHLVADFNSGFQGDELLHIETGNHLALGYMEFPPVIGYLAFIQNLFQSDSVFVNHIFAHIASLLILILLALSAVQLGAKWKAVFLLLLCILVAPAFGRSHQLFQPVVFSQLFWLLSFYQLIRFVKTLDHKYLFYLAISAGFGFLTKYDILFFIVGVLSLLFFKRTREAVLSKNLWKYIGLFLMMIIPNIWWQYQNDFPFFQMFSRLYETQLDHLNALGVVKNLVISLNPFTMLFWIGGFVFMFNSKNKIIFRPIAISILLSILFLALAKSKAYYFYPLMMTLMLFGAIWVEQKILEKQKWILYPISSILVFSGLFMLPFGLAIFPLERFIEFAHIEKNGDRFEVEYQEYYSKGKWEKTMFALESVYDSLPKNEKQDCLIWGKHYSQAGGVNLFRKDTDLPPAFSYHGSFYLWTPKEGKMPNTVIAFTNGEAEIDFFQSFFTSVVPVKKVYNPYADFEEDLYQTIFICKEAKLDYREMRAEFRPRVFE